MFNEFQVRMRGRRKFLVWGNVLLSLILIRAFTWLTKKVFHRLRTIQAEKVLLFFQPFQLLSPGFRQIKLKLNFEASPASSRAIFDLIVFRRGFVDISQLHRKIFRKTFCQKSYLRNLFKVDHLSKHWAKHCHRTRQWKKQ